METQTPPLESNGYSLLGGAHVALEALAAACGSELPREVDEYIKYVTFWNSATSSDSVCFPCPLKEQETGSALKALEGCAAAALAQLRYGAQGRGVEVDVGKVAAFMMSAYLTTLDGMGKSHTKIKLRLPGWSLWHMHPCVHSYIHTYLPPTYMP